MNSRGDALERLATNKFDLLVIGGGITGAGVALDAATRGLAVGLIERRDFASGTSSKSSKLVHGGLRYLEHKEIGLMHEAATERDLLRRIAPHLVTPIGFVWPNWAGASTKAGLGLWVYDVLAGFKNVRRHDKLSEAEMADVLPAARRSSGGYLYYDSQTDDSRLVLAILQAAQRAGAVVCNYVDGQAFLETSHHVEGVFARDQIAGDSFEMHATDVVNATGVWADELLGIEDRTAEICLRPSKGIHIVLKKDALPLKMACLFPSPAGKLVFAVPWRSSVLVGTTDDEYDGPLHSPTVTADETAFMLQALSQNFRRNFSIDHVAGAYAGLRPLLAGSGDESTRDLSRKHAIIEGPKGLVTVTGGKLTTYRLMAEEVVDVVTSRRGRKPKCVTGSTSLGVRDLRSLLTSVADEVDALGLPARTTDSLVRSYGDDALAVLGLAREEDLAEPIAEGLGYLMAEIAWGIRHEMATCAEDILARRTRLSLEDRDSGLQQRAKIESLLGRELKLSSEATRASIEDYEAAVQRESGLGRQPAKTETKSSVGRR